MCASLGEVPDRVVRFELAGAKLCACADRSTVERLIDLKQLNVGLHVVHPPTHVGIDAGERVLDGYLAVGVLRPLYFLESECLSVQPSGLSLFLSRGCESKTPRMRRAGRLVAPPTGLEPVTLRLTVECSAN